MSTFPDATRSRPSAAANGSGGLDWRVLVDGELPGRTNMACDHALAALARPGEGTVRFYRWATATLSFGRNEPVTVGYRELLRQSPGMEAVRRPTGGRAVIHDRELTYCVVLPVRAFGGLRAAYRKINGGLLRGLRRLGVDAGGAPGRAAAPDSGPCFFEAAEGEVVVRGRKLVGSAQARIGGAILQHGSMLLVADQSALFTGAGARGLEHAGLMATGPVPAVPEPARLEPAVLAHAMLMAMGGTPGASRESCPRPPRSAVRSRFPRFSARFRRGRAWWTRFGGDLPRNSGDCGRAVR